MAVPPSISRVLITAATCGIVDYVLTWLVHLLLKGFLRVASPFYIDGTCVAISGGVLGALFGLFLSRMIARPVLRGFLCVLVVLLIAIVVPALGVSGMISMGYLIPLIEARFPLKANQGNKIIPIGYYLMPLVWTAVLWWVLRWYFKVRRGRSLLNFDQTYLTDSQPVTRKFEMRELLSLLRYAVLSSVVAWLVHSQFAGGRSWLHIDSPLEGAMNIISSGVAAAIGMLFICRTVKFRWVAEGLGAAMALITGIAFGFAGMVGSPTACILFQIITGKIANKQFAAAVGYYALPPIWAATISWGLCWYYKATHADLHLVDFDSTPNDSEQTL